MDGAPSPWPGGPGPARAGLRPDRRAHVSFSYARGSCVLGGPPRRPDTRRGNRPAPDLRPQDHCEDCDVPFHPVSRCVSFVMPTASAGGDRQAAGAVQNRPVPAGRLACQGQAGEPAAVVVDGAVHGRAGLHHRQRGAAVDPAGPARRHDDAAVGDQWLRGGVRRVLATGWAARRRLRPGQAVPDRAGRIHPGEHLRRPGRRAGAADHFPGGAGDRRGYASARGPVAAGHQLARGKGTRPRAGHLWRDRLGGLRVRRGARRPAGRDHLAAGVLRQRPDRHRPAGRLDAAATPQIRPGTEAAWTFPAR